MKAPTQWMETVSIDHDDALTGEAGIRTRARIVLLGRFIKPLP